MFDSIKESLRKVFSSEQRYSDLDHYINAHDPQTNDDVERLEKEFYEKRQRDYNYF